MQTLLGVLLGLVAQLTEPSGCAVNRMEQDADAIRTKFTAMLDERKCAPGAQAGADLPVWSEQPPVSPRPPVDLKVSRHVSRTDPRAPDVALDVEPYGIEAGVVVAWSIHDAITCTLDGDHPAWLSSGAGAAQPEGILIHVAAPWERLDADMVLLCANGHGETLASIHVAE